MINFRQGKEIVIDEATFGVLEFWGYGRTDNKRNEETGEYDVFNRHIYDVLCEKTSDVLSVSIYNEEYVVDFPTETPVVLINPKIDGFMTDNGDERTYIVADGIEAVQTNQAKHQPQQSTQQPKQNNK